MKSPLNTYSNPQSTLARLSSSDGSKRLRVEWWQIKMQMNTLSVPIAVICLGASDENHAEEPLNLSLGKVRHNLRNGYSI